jgi:hypothetical protein
MAHFAQLDENNVVLQVVVVSNRVINDLEFPESEPLGIDFCRTLFGENTNWKQTSYNSNFRVRYAMPGYVYDSAYDAFIKPKPLSFPSFVLDPATTEWVPPLPRPTDTVYEWLEASVAWVAIPAPFPSWVMKGDPLYWAAPVKFPTDGKAYRWDEDSLSWVEVEGASV